jgi:hypothetical protein
MNNPWISTAFCTLAGIVLLAGVIASISSLSRYATVQQRLAKAVAVSERLGAIEQEFAELDALDAPFDGLRYDNLIDPVVLVNTGFGAKHVEDVRRNVQPCGGGYAVNRIEVSLKDVALANLLPFIRTAESLRPPLRLTACTIHASPAEPGSGDVVLTLERIERMQ